MILSCSSRTFGVDSILLLTLILLTGRLASRELARLFEAKPMFFVSILLSYKSLDRLISLIVRLWSSVSSTFTVPLMNQRGFGSDIAFQYSEA